MTTSNAGRIAASPHELRALGTRLSVIRSDLEMEADTLDAGEALQSALIEGALRDFRGAWSQRRGVLVHLLTGAESVLSASAEHFEQADAALAAAFDQGAPRSAATTS
jgi:hypothetical protein